MHSNWVLGWQMICHSGREILQSLPFLFPTPPPCPAKRKRATKQTNPNPPAKNREACEKLMNHGES